jgi:hypothetical protein
MAAGRVRCGIEGDRCVGKSGTCDFEGKKIDARGRGWNNGTEGRCGREIHGIFFCFWVHLVSKI